MSKNGEKLVEALEDVIAYQRGELELPETPVVPTPVDARAVRRKLGLTQEQFAARFGIPLPTLRGWEQGNRAPRGSARILLRVIERDPDAVARAVREQAEVDPPATAVAGH
jgi:putative transcriptional regulator